MQKQTTLQRKVKENEIRLALFLTEHDLSIAITDHLLELITTFDPKSNIIAKMTSARTKSTAIHRNVISPFQFQDTISILQQHQFSLMIDETTDHTTKKHLVLVAR